MIELKGISKSFNSHLVLDSLDLKVETGETKVIIGRSGGGKSVLLKHIVGLLRPDSGTVLVDGQDIWKLDKKKMNQLHMKIEMVFQGGALFDSLSVWENVGFILKEYSTLKEKEIRERVREALALVNLYDIEDKFPSELSGGMKKRVSLARALCVRPQIILYDEPTTGIDPITADAINNLIDELHDKIKITSIVVTHDMRSAYKVADKIAMLYNGKIIAEGTPDEIRYTHDPIVHQFITGAAVGPITAGAGKG